MSPSSKMGNEGFQERWEFRRRDEDFNSSSDESKSESSGKPVLKKHKLVTSLGSDENENENDQTSDTLPVVQQKGNDQPGPGGHSKSTKAKKCKKKQIRSSKKSNMVNNDRKKKESLRKISKKKSKSSISETPSLDDVKIFMKSLLEELTLTQKTLLVWMEDEMHKLMAGNNPLQPTRREDNNKNKSVQVQNQNNFVSEMKLMADNTTHQPTRRESRYEREILQVQHQNNFESGMNLMANDTTRQLTRGAGSNGQEIAHVQQQGNFELGMSMMMTNVTTQQPTRRERTYGQETLQVQHQANFESGIKLMTDNTTWQPLRREGSYGRQNVQVQSQNSFNPGTKLIADDMNRQLTRREGNYGQDIIDVQHQNNFGSGLKAQKGRRRPLEKSTKTQKVADSKHRYQVSKNQVEPGQDSRFMTEKANGEKVDLFVKPHFSSASSEQVPSSMYLTLPSVIAEPCVTSHRISSSSCNYIHPGSSGNITSTNLERANLMLEASQRGYFSGMQKEQLKSITQLGSKNMGCVDQSSAPTSGIGSGFPVPLHQDLDHHFSIPNRVGIENQPQENNDILGPKMNGEAISYSGGIHSLSEDYVTNNFRSNMNYKAADGRFMANRTQNLKGGDAFPI